MLRVTLVGLVVAFSVVSHGETARASKSAAQVAIEKVLDEPTTAEFFDAPLHELVDWWKDLHEIEIQLDTAALDRVGLGIDSPITIELKGVSFESALNLALKDLDLTWMICNEVLLITTGERAESVLTVQIYPVGDLQLAAIPQAEPSYSYASANPSMTGANQLSQVVSRMIVPESWVGQGGRGAIEAASPSGVDVLIVRQTRDVHRQIANLLDRLRVAAEPAHRSDRPTTVFDSALKSPTTVEFFDAPLQELVNWWKDLHNIEIQLDTGALDSVGIGSDTPVTAEIKGVSFESALNLVLDQLDLTWTICRDEILLITTQEEAASMFSGRIHHMDSLRLSQDPSGELDAWVRTITTAIGPQSAAGSVAQISVNNVPLLVVHQTFENHRQIEKLLAELRSIGEGAEQ